MEVNGVKYSVILWTVWFVYWIVSARQRVRHTDQVPTQREPLAGRLLYLGLMVLGFGLVFWRRAAFSLGQLWSPGEVALAVGLAVQAAGLAFAIWARRTLGSNWAGRITIGGSQELVVRGPYRLVRHPIYSGLLFGFLGTAIVQGQGRGFLGLVLVLAGVVIKLRREEAALRKHFGTAYQEYASRVPGLIPIRLG
jgi:protein-S-isoprenylcysteine O-methyltransferase Ste14